MYKLITLGCSFSKGEGCYNMDLLKSYNIKHHENLYTVAGCGGNREYFEYHKKFELENSIGKHIQDEFGFEEYYNYAHGGSSNQTQVLKFFNNIPIGDDVTVLWQITFNNRKVMIFNNRFEDMSLDSEWVKLYYKDLMTIEDEFEDNPIEYNERLELGMYINIMNEYCKSRRWKLYTWFYPPNQYKPMLNIFPKFNDFIIPYNNFSIEELESYKDITGDIHPNQFGYRKIADGLIKTIRETYSEFPNPNETPIKWESIDRYIQ
tara:strand:+ start:34 stop:822 length:789 start_codon:yes stop_codon:yes gene_type:complete